MRKVKSFESSKLAIVAGVVFLIAGCGKAEQTIVAPAPAPVVQQPGTPPPANRTTCPVGQVSIGDGPCVVGDFRSACTHWLYGGLLTTAEGREVCKISGTHYLTLGGSGYMFPIITPSSPTGSYSSQTNVKVRVSDQLTIESVNGSWGGSSMEFKKFLGFISTTVWTMDCKQIGVDGLKDGTLVSYEGQPAGLFGSDGTNAFPILKGITNHRVAAHGNLRLGFNAPDPYNSCGTVSLRVKVTHCEDAGGNSYLCP